MKKTYKVLGTYVVFQEKEGMTAVKARILDKETGVVVDGYGTAICNEIDYDHFDEKFGVYLAKERAIRDAVFTLQQEYERTVEHLNTKLQELNTRLAKIKTERAALTGNVQRLIDSTSQKPAETDVGVE